MRSRSARACAGVQASWPMWSSVPSGCAYVPSGEVMTSHVSVRTTGDGPAMDRANSSRELVTV